MNKKIQVLRTAAICAVVMIHTRIDGEATVVIRQFINYAVAMFIFISGYLTKPEQKDLKKFYAKRISRVLAPYLIWSVVYTVLYGTYDLFFVNLLSAKCCFTFYFIFVYIQLVLITPFVGHMVMSKYNWIGWCITPLSVILLRYITTFTGIDIPFSSANLFVWFVFYYLGMMLGNNIIEYKLSYVKSFILYGVSLTLSEAEGLLWFFYGNFDMASNQLKLTSVITSVIVLLIAYKYIRDDRFVLKDNLISRLLVLIGDCSFGIYLSHIFVLSVLHKLPGYDYLRFPLTSIMVVAVSALCVMLGKAVLEKVALGKKISSYLGL